MVCGKLLALLHVPFLLLTQEQSSEGAAKLDRHDVVEDGVNCAVHVNHDTTQQAKPEVVKLLVGERVVDDKQSVGQPQQRKRHHDDDQHLHDL